MIYSFEDFLPQGGFVRTIQTQIHEKRLVHALLISGEPGTGKRTFAKMLSAALLCRAEKNKPCGICTECQKVILEEHPDLIVLRKGEPISDDGRKGLASIPVNDIREIIRKCSAFSFENGNRVVLIEEAENMTVQAQNCLLKILENPPEDTYFFLTSSHTERILTTVKSRCRPVKMKPWSLEYICNTLIKAGVETSKAQKAASASFGSIGMAHKLANDDDYWTIRDQVIHSFFLNDDRSSILSLSQRWKDLRNDADKLFDILEESIHSLIQYRLGEVTADYVQVFSQKWLVFAQCAGMNHFTFLLDQIAEARKKVAFNVGFQVVIEQLLLSFIGESELWKK